MSPRLRPGQVLELRFPELPLTLHARCRKRQAQPRLLAALPNNYSPDRRFPLLVYVHGGAGAAGNRQELDYVRKLTDDRDFIAVSLPLFKKELDPREIHGGILIGTGDDYPVIAKCYRRMLGELLKRVPNITKKGSCFGGFSNGGHVTALMLSAVDRFTLAHFDNFYLLDGGFAGITSFHKLKVQEKNLIWFIGAENRGYRRSLVAVMKLLQKRAKRMGSRVAVRFMPDVGHAFPDEYIPELRQWIYAANGWETEPAE